MSDALDGDRSPRAAGVMTLLRWLGREIREAFESTPPTSAEWCIAGDILGAVPVRIDELKQEHTRRPQ